MAVAATARSSDVAVETCTTDVRDTLLTYSEASTLSRGDLLSVSFVISFSSLETTSGTATVIDFVEIVQDHDVDAHLYNAQFMSMACCQKTFDHKVEKHKQSCDVPCILYFNQ